MPPEAKCSVIAAATGDTLLRPRDLVETSLPADKAPETVEKKSVADAPVQRQSVAVTGAERGPSPGRRLVEARLTRPVGGDSGRFRGTVEILTVVSLTSFNLSPAALGCTLTQTGIISFPDPARDKESRRENMGAQLAKGGVAVEGKAIVEPAAAKANGQENGHVKTNGDVSAKPDGEVAAADGNGTAEPAKEGEASAGDAIEPAPAAEGEAAKAEGEAAKEVKKKKKFSLKNSFKFKGINLKKSKKAGEEGKEEATSPTAEDKPEENGHTAKETKEETPAPEAKEGEAAAAAAAATPEGETKAAEEAPATEAAPAEEPAAPAPAEVTTPAAPEGEAKAE
ncbi:unnamed protein product [Pleuronectes platessa]|uniref:Uncharacterized protein n=1 Tax=Pleuronectes platessa TaxID=8262 RepID=A0A9N7VEU7_PLEPL|nr:unnamed protein product [Pleuronectes platessa]